MGKIKELHPHHDNVGDEDDKFVFKCDRCPNLSEILVVVRVDRNSTNEICMTCLAEFLGGGK